VITVTGNSSAAKAGLLAEGLRCEKAGLLDRALALDTIAIHLIGLVILLTIRFGSLVFFDGALILSLLGFAGTIAVAQYIGRMHLRRRTGRNIPEDVDR
jgi:hypothetical protein